MTSLYIQHKRVARFTTPLGEEKLILKSFEGEERMSALFEYRIQAISLDADLDFDKAIGRNCTLEMNTIGGGKRCFDGILTDVLLLASDKENDEGVVFQLTLRPWLWLLSKTRNSLIFHEKTAPEIISEIFGEHGALARFEQRLERAYPKLEYCVQYRESDMDFVLRLAEDHGIAFHFRHDPGRHTLILADGPGAYRPVAGTMRPYIGVEKRHVMETEHLFHWAPQRRFVTGRMTLNDYDFKRPAANLVTGRAGDAKYAHAGLEAYDYPGKYVVEKDGGDHARQRVDAEQAQDGRFLGRGDCLSCMPGDLVTLKEHPQKSHNRQYLVLGCTHSFSGQIYRSTSEPDSEDYHGSYEFMDAHRPFAPPRLTPKPFLRGPQTAVVVGDGEIDCDEHGRIKVRFHWDRKDDHSMRVRVAQVWASQQWGGIFIPRVGMEVVVDFLEGDPDRPIVVGCVYNGDNKPPYPLPDEKNIAGWKSNSTPSSDGYNEFIMDDTAGSELVRFHAERDLDGTVKNDERRKVDNDRETKIGVNDTLDVGMKLLIKAGQEIKLQVGDTEIVMDQMSIRMKTKMFKVEADAMLETHSKALASHKADAVMTIQGLIVKIN